MYVCVFTCTYIYIYIYNFRHRYWLAHGHATTARARGRVSPDAFAAPLFTQFPSQDSGLFGPNPWKILAPPSNYLSKNSFWATQPLGQIL